MAFAFLSSESLTAKWQKKLSKALAEHNKKASSLSSMEGEAQDLELHSAHYNINSKSLDLTQKVFQYGDLSRSNDIHVEHYKNDGREVEAAMDNENVNDPTLHQTPQHEKSAFFNSINTENPCMVDISYTLSNPRNPNMFPQDVQDSLIGSETSQNQNITSSTELTHANNKKSSNNMKKVSTKSRSKSSATWPFFIIPFVTVLREGLEGSVFLGGISLGESYYNIPLAAAAGLACGSLIGFLTFKVGV
jgi:hypothetical protein